MEFLEKDKYCSISIKQSLQEESLKEFQRLISRCKCKSIVVLFKALKKGFDNHVPTLTNIAKTKKSEGFSFVIVISEVNADNYPEELNIVPTLTEAEDVIDMENIERELGF